MQPNLRSPRSETIRRSMSKEYISNFSCRLGVNRWWDLYDQSSKQLGGPVGSIIRRGVLAGMGRGRKKDADHEAVDA